VSTDEQTIIKGVMESATTVVEEIMTARANVKHVKATDFITNEKRYQL